MTAAAGPRKKLSWPEAPSAPDGSWPGIM
jgi:hypothetical protein